MYIRRFVSIFGTVTAIFVCAAITFLSSDVDRTTLLFNLAFLSVMLLMVLIACLTGIRRLMRATGALRRGAKVISRSVQEGQPITQVSFSGQFENDFLDDCYSQYRLLSEQNPDGGCDLRSFLNEEAVETHVHRGLLECIPDILTSLGILGTFIGLVMGLREFDPSGYEQMAGSVTPLINGIKVAFITSIYGLALSLSFSFTLRSEFGELSAAMEAFLEAWYLHVQPPYEVDSLTRLLASRRDQEDVVHDLTGIFVEQMGKSFEQSITPAFAQMADGFRDISDTFLHSQEALLTQVCETVTRQMRTELLTDFEQISQTVDSLVRTQASYTDFMDRTMLRMQNTLAELQDAMNRTQSYVADSVSALAKAQGDAQKINEEQKNTYQEYIRFMYQSLERFSEVWEKNSQSIQNYTDEIARMSPVQSGLALNERLDKLAAQLQLMQEHMEAASPAAFPATPASENTQELFDQTMKKLSELEELVSRPVLFRRRKGSL